MCQVNDVKFSGLRAEMARCGHNQKTLADLLELPQSAISNRLNGIVEWTVFEIDKICAFYEKSYEELFK